MKILNIRNVLRHSFKWGRSQGGLKGPHLKVRASIVNVLVSKDGKICPLSMILKCPSNPEFVRAVPLALRLFLNSMFDNVHCIVQAA